MLKKKTCEAFPDGIPDKLQRNLFIHNKPYPGDQGIIFGQDPNNKFTLDIEKMAAEAEED